MKLIALTGGIGSGKSTVADLLRQRGISVLDADQMAREVLTPEMVREHFGEQFLEQGQINRKKLGEHVFSAPDERQKLESLTHPLIAQRLSKELEVLETKEVVVYEAALIFEKGLQDRFNATILVTAPESTRLMRLQARADMGAEEATQRMKAQMSDEEKRPLATYVLHNSGTLEDLKIQVDALGDIVGL